MLEFEITKQPDAVEKYFCEPFTKVRPKPMSNELAEYLLKMMFIKKTKPISENEKPFIIKLIEKRIEVVYEYSITDIRLTLFIALLSESPGKAVMYMTYLQYWCKKNNQSELNLDLFCEEIFPFGFPTDEDLHNLWDNQKLKTSGHSLSSDNLLDYRSAMVSLKF